MTRILAGYSGACQHRMRTGTSFETEQRSMFGVSPIELAIVGLVCLAPIAVLVVILIVVFATKRTSNTSSNLDLVQCADCGRPVSRHAVSCPQCGRPLEGAK